MKRLLLAIAVTLFVAAGLYAADSPSHGVLIPGGNVDKRGDSLWANLVDEKSDFLDISTELEAFNIRGLRVIVWNLTANSDLDSMTVLTRGSMDAVNAVLLDSGEVDPSTAGSKYTFYIYSPDSLYDYIQVVGRLWGDNAGSDEEAASIRTAIYFVDGNANIVARKVWPITAVDYVE